MYHHAVVGHELVRHGGAGDQAINITRNIQATHCFGSQLGIGVCGFTRFGINRVVTLTNAVVAQYDATGA